MILRSHAVSKSKKYFLDAPEQYIEVIECASKKDTGKLKVQSSRIKFNLDDQSEKNLIVKNSLN